MGNSISRRAALTAVAVLAASAAFTAQAQVKVGVVLSLTGPAASLGIPEKNALQLLPREIAGQKIEYIVLDDATDTTTAVKTVRRLVTEEQVDVIIGPSVTPNALAVLDVIAEARTPMVALAASQRIVSPANARRRWAFKTTQNDTDAAALLLQHMTEHGVKTLAYAGFANAAGDAWWDELQRIAPGRQVRLVANERYAAGDTSVMAQALRVLAANPDAVFIGASGSPALLPHRTLVEQGYRGRIYLNQGVANVEFLRMGGKQVEGAFIAMGPAVLARQLAADNQLRAPAMALTEAYEARYGQGTLSSFAAHAWDAGLLLQGALPVALKRARPGTPEFRAALRDAFEGLHDLPVSMGMVNMKPDDHVGYDRRSLVLARIVDGDWKLIAESKAP